MSADEIFAIREKIASTEVQLARAENSNERIVWATLLAKQQDTLNILLTRESAGAPIVIFHPFTSLTIQLYVFPSY